MCHFHESGDVGALHVVGVSVFTAIAQTLVVDGAHDAVQTVVDLLSRPRDVHGVLRHFQTRSGNATCVYSLARCEVSLVLDEIVNSFGRTSHVAHFSHELHAVFNQLACVFFAQFVLRGARQGNVNVFAPGLLASVESGFG